MTEQLALFPAGIRKTYGETELDRMRTLATSPEVIEAAVSMFRSRPGEFISTFELFNAIRDRFNLGSYVMDTLHHLNYRLGLLDEKRIYSGAESPLTAPKAMPGKRGKQAALEKPYLGYASLWRLEDTT